MDILTHPNPALRVKATDVDPKADTELESLVKTMAQAMYDAPGIGIAAPQVGVLKRVIAFDLDEGLIALCNPVIVSASEETDIEEEGCLSLPGITVPIARSVSVVCEALNLKGEPVRIEATELAARMLQHETDHLDGLLIIDRATPDERKAAIRRYNEAQNTE
jgi:peptide deformylase